MKRAKKQIYLCPAHKEQLWQVNHGFSEDIYICQTYKCGYRLVLEGTEPVLKKWKKSRGIYGCLETADKESRK